jgi:hypothetical protein
LKLITITVSPTGETQLETSGFTGNSCQQASQALATALGIQTQEQLKSDYFLQLNTQSNTVQH